MLQYLSSFVDSLRTRLVLHFRIYHLWRLKYIAFYTDVILFTLFGFSMIYFRVKQAALSFPFQRWLLIRFAIDSLASDDFTISVPSLACCDTMPTQIHGENFDNFRASYELKWPIPTSQMPLTRFRHQRYWFRHSILSHISHDTERFFSQQRISFFRYHHLCTTSPLVYLRYYWLFHCFFTIVSRHFH